MCCLPKNRIFKIHACVKVSSTRYTPQRSRARPAKVFLASCALTCPDTSAVECLHRRGKASFFDIRQRADDSGSFSSKQHSHSIHRVGAVAASCVPRRDLLPTMAFTTAWLHRAKPSSIASQWTWSRTWSLASSCRTDLAVFQALLLPALLLLPHCYWSARQACTCRTTDGARSACGCAGSGKSSLGNALLGVPRFAVGTRTTLQSGQFGANEDLRLKVCGIQDLCVNPHLCVCFLCAWDHRINACCCRCGTASGPCRETAASARPTPKL